MHTRSFALLVALGLPTISAQPQRRPLAVEPLTNIAFRPTGTRLRVNPDGKTHSKYAVDGAIDYIPATQSFVLSWNGADGTRERMTYEPRTMALPVVATAVTFDAASRLYTYSYEFTNLPGAKQHLQSVYMETTLPQRARGPNGWYSAQFTTYLKKQFAVSDGWGLSQIDGTLGIPPGQQASGFQLSSVYPPGIVRCWAAGRAAPLAGGNSELPDALHAALDAVAWVLPKGSCVGPVLVNGGETAGARLNRLAAMVDQAEQQGWLGPATTASVVRSSLAPIRAALTQGTSAPAAGQIGTLLQDLDGAKYAGMLSEGRALLEFQLGVVRDRIR